jgi:hypothetical protein
VSDRSRYFAVEKSLEDWQQGDLTLESVEFIYKSLAALPVTAPPSETTEVSETLSAESPGLVVISQTCDIQRAVSERPYVLMSPLMTCPESFPIDEVEKGLRPQYALVPAVASLNLVADLDQVMTVEKPLLVSWHRTRGCRNDEELREFASNLARKFSRFAFPNDFMRWIGKFRDSIKGKHGSSFSEEGAALRALREIRVTATPTWHASEIELFFHFVREEDEPNGPSKPWYHWLGLWLSSLKPAGRFKRVEGVVLPPSNILMSDYLVSDRLDLDHLSRSV